MIIKGIALLKDVFRVALWNRALSLIFLTGSFISAVTEMLFLALLYALFSPEKRNAIVSWINANAYFLNPAQLKVIGERFTYILIAGAVIMLFMRLFFAISSRFAIARIQVNTSVRLSNKLLSAFLDAHPAAWASWKKEKIINIMTNETAAAGELIYMALSMLMSITVMIALTAGAFVISAELTIFSVIIGVIVLMVNYTNYAKARKIGIIKVKMRAQLIGYAYDVVSGHKILKLEGAEDFIKVRSAGIIRDSYAWVLTKTRNINAVMSFSELFVYFFFFGLILMANIFKIFDQAVLLTLLVISIRLQGSVRELQNQWMSYQELIPNFIDIRNMLSYAEGYITGRGIREKRKPALYVNGAGVGLDNVDFSYTEGGPTVVKSLSASFTGGKKFLIKGVSGSGKSTLINLISGIVRPTGGRIMIDGSALTGDGLYAIRDFTSYSSPDAYIFRGTIRDNISLGMVFSEKEIMEAARKAGLEEFINKQEKGIDSSVTDNATNISLGERQRIMLARMFLKMPRLILLDEATSNLDLEMEDMILKNLVRHLPEATLIMVTHRAPRNFTFDKKFELKDGKLVTAQ